MEEFGIFKKALERTGAKLNIKNWDFDGYNTEQLIEDFTHHIALWFTDGELTDIDIDVDTH